MWKENLKKIIEKYELIDSAKINMVLHYAKTFLEYEKDVNKQFYLFPYYFAYRYRKTPENYVKLTEINFHAIPSVLSSLFAYARDYYKLYEPFVLKCDNSPLLSFVDISSFLFWHPLPKPIKKIFVVKNDDVTLPSNLQLKLKYDMVNISKWWDDENKDELQKLDMGIIMRILSYGEGINALIFYSFVKERNIIFDNEILQLPFLEKEDFRKAIKTAFQTDVQFCIFLLPLLSYEQKVIFLEEYPESEWPGIDDFQRYHLLDVLDEEIIINFLFKFKPLLESLVLLWLPFLKERALKRLMLKGDSSLRSIIKNIL